MEKNKRLYPVSKELFKFNEEPRSKREPPVRRGMDPALQSKDFAHHRSPLHLDRMSPAGFAVRIRLLASDIRPVFMGEQRGIMGKILLSFQEEEGTVFNEVMGLRGAAPEASVNRRFVEPKVRQTFGSEGY